VRSAPSPSKLCEIVSSAHDHPRTLDNAGITQRLAAIPGWTRSGDAPDSGE
jgi:hypothetical protein